MDFLDVINTRHSVRTFKPDQVSEEILLQILEAGRISPSAQNRQCWRFIVINDKELIKKIAYHSFVGTVNYFIKDAPVLIIACADTKKALRFNNQDYYLVDVAIAFQQMILTAWNFKVATCWMAAFNEAELKKILNLPEHIRIVALSPFGYATDKSSLYSKAVSFVSGSKKRLSLDKIVSYNKWNNSDALLVEDIEEKEEREGE